MTFEMTPEPDQEVILKPRSEGASTLAERIRTGRRELRQLLPQRLTHSAPKGVQREQAKRPAGVSARQWKIQKKFRKRWYKANVSWFGAEAAGRIHDKRIPVVL